MRHPRPIALFTIVGLSSALLGVLMLLLFTTPYMIFRTRGEILRADERALFFIRSFVSASNDFLYGRVISVDESTQTLTVAIMDPFGQSADTVLRVRVEIPAYIARQELHRTNGIVDSLSRKTISSLSDMRAGDRIAIGFVKGDDGSFVTHYLLFGEPL